jgi:acyl dehydratase
MAVPDDVDAPFDAYCARTRELTGKRVCEWETWNTEASADAIHHFALGTDDDNPLWLDADYAGQTTNGSIVAPPCFLTSVSYPILHGAGMEPPLTSLIGGLEIEWFAPIRLGDRLSVDPVQKDFYEKRNKAGRRLGFVISEIGYRNQDEALVGRATGTLIIMGAAGEQPSAHTPVQRYGSGEIAALDAAMASETRTGGGAFHFEDVAVGDAVPPIVRGPFTVGDLVCWYAAAGPGWRPGRLGRIELNEFPHLATANPLTGVPVKYPQKHLEFDLAQDSGLAGPFDNGVMRFSTAAPLITNWMGDRGFLKRFRLRIERSVIYGDTITYSARVTATDAALTTISLDVRGVDQRGDRVASGAADVILPRRA